MHTIKKNPFYRVLSFILVLIITCALILSPNATYAQSVLGLPVPGTMVMPSDAFMPVMLKGMTIDTDNPLKFDFIIDSGNTTFNQDELKQESSKLIKYFLASLTVPQDELWVNLSPNEKDRIIPDALGQTELGQDLLAQDYILKQLTASLMYPEEELGKEFWDKVYQQAQDQYGTTDIPIDTFNKVWIIPQSASVYEHDKTVYVVESKLKVLTDQDYWLTQDARRKTQDESSDTLPTGRQASRLTSDIVKTIIIPAIEKEVNEGANFAPLRQIYHSLILAKWYKETLKNSILNQAYVDQNKITGIENEDREIKNKIYEQYMQAYKKGVYDYMREDYDAVKREVIPRKYFSGGFKDVAMAIKREDVNVASKIQSVGQFSNVSVELKGKGKAFDEDTAMVSEVMNFLITNKEIVAGILLAGVVGAGAYAANRNKPWSLPAARKMLDNYEIKSNQKLSYKQVRKALEMIAASDEKQDFERLINYTDNKPFSEMVIGRLTTDDFIAGLSSENLLIRRRALKQLTKIDYNENKKVIDALITIGLKDSDVEIRMLTRKYLRESFKHSKEIWDDILTAITSESTQEKMQGFKYLKTLGNDIERYDFLLENFLKIDKKRALELMLSLKRKQTKNVLRKIKRALKRYGLSEEKYLYALFPDAMKALYNGKPWKVFYEQQTSRQDSQIEAPAERVYILVKDVPLENPKQIAQNEARLELLKTEDLRIRYTLEHLREMKEHSEKEILAAIEFIGKRIDYDETFYVRLLNILMLDNEKYKEKAKQYLRIEDYAKGLMSLNEDIQQVSKEMLQKIAPDAILSQEEIEQGKAKRLKAKRFLQSKIDRDNHIYIEDWIVEEVCELLELGMNPEDIDIGTHTKEVPNDHNRFTHSEFDYFTVKAFYEHHFDWEDTGIDIVEDNAITVGGKWTVKDALKILDEAEDYSDEEVLDAIEIVGYRIEDYEGYIVRLLNVLTLGNELYKEKAKQYLRKEDYIKGLMSLNEDINQVSKDMLMNLDPESILSQKKIEEGKEKRRKAKKVFESKVSEASHLYIKDWHVEEIVELLDLGVKEKDIIIDEFWVKDPFFNVMRFTGFKIEDNAMVIGPFTAKGAREVLDNPQEFSSRKIIRAIHVLEKKEDPREADINRLKGILLSADENVRNAAKVYFTQKELVTEYSQWVPNKVAVEELGNELNKGNQDAIQALIIALPDQPEISSIGLRKIAKKGDREVISGLLKLLPEDLLIVAITLKDVAEVGDQEVITAFVKQLETLDDEISFRYTISLLKEMGVKVEPIEAIVKSLRSQAVRKVGTLGIKTFDQKYYFERLVWHAFKFQREGYGFQIKRKDNVTATSESHGERGILDFEVVRTELLPDAPIFTLDYKVISPKKSYNDDTAMTTEVRLNQDILDGVKQYLRTGQHNDVFWSPYGENQLNRTAAWFIQQFQGQKADYEVTYLKEGRKVAKLKKSELTNGGQVDLFEMSLKQARIFAEAVKSFVKWQETDIEILKETNRIIYARLGDKARFGSNWILERVMEFIGLNIPFELEAKLYQPQEIIENPHWEHWRQPAKGEIILTYDPLLRNETPYLDSQSQEDMAMTTSFKNKILTSSVLFAGALALFLSYPDYAYSSIPPTNQPNQQAISHPQETIKKRDASEQLIYAVIAKDPVKVEEILKDKTAYYDINARDTMGGTLLMFAIGTQLPEVAKILVKYGADVNIATNKRVTPLMIAVATENVELVQLLLENPYDLQNVADPNVITEDGTTAMFLAKRHGNPKIMALLRKHGAKEAHEINGKDQSRIDSNQKTLVDTFEYNADDALATKAPGGIDMNKIDVKRQGRTGEIQFKLDAPNQIDINKIDGFMPVIIHITPIINIYPLLGLADPESQKTDYSQRDLSVLDEPQKKIL